MNQKSSVPDYRPLELMLDNRITKSDFDDFIGVWPNFMPRPVCDELREFIDNTIEQACVINPSLDLSQVDSADRVIKSQDLYGGEMNRKDMAFILNYANRDLVLKINSILRSCVLHYISQYQSLTKTSLISSDIKIQKTPPSEAALFPRQGQKKYSKPDIILGTSAAAFFSKINEEMQ